DRTHTDPKLEALAHNGGPTETRALASDSPAINAAGRLGCPKRDQRGVKRPKGPACDIGAYEAEVPNVKTRKARQLGSHGATLRGREHPHGHHPTCVFECGKTRAYGSSAATKAAGAGRTSVALSIHVSAL